MTFPLRATVIFASCFCFSSLALSASNGSTPNGKPFIELNGQIIEIQNDLSEVQARYDAIVLRIDSLEADLQGKIDALTNEISILKQADANLVAQLVELADQVRANGYDIDTAIKEVNRLQQEIDALYASTADNSALVAQLQATLDDYKAQIADQASGILSILATLTQNGTLLTQLNTKVASLQTDLAKKQNDISGSCAAGSFVYSVENNGQLNCAEADANGTITSITSSYNVSINNWTSTECTLEGLGVCLQETTTFHQYTGEIWVYCPAGYQMSGGGFGVPSELVQVLSSRPITNENGWYVKAKNTATANTSFSRAYAYVRCLAMQ